MSSIPRDSPTSLERKGAASMALRSLTESYVIERDSLSQSERDESSKKIHSFMSGFTSQRLEGNSDLQRKTGIGFKKN
jgi:hypothetical protein